MCVECRGHHDRQVEGFYAGNVFINASQGSSHYEESKMLYFRSMLACCFSYISLVKIGEYVLG